MFEALLAAIPDRDFYEKGEFSAQIREAYLHSEIPYGCLVGGAKLWDLALHTEYPVYSLCKTNNEDNKDFAPFRDANLVLSSTETGELITFIMREDSGKMPLYNPKPAPQPKFDLPVAKSYSVAELWKPVPSARLPECEDRYQAFIHVGNFQSEPYLFHVVTGGKTREQCAFERELTMDAEPAHTTTSTSKVTFTDGRGSKVLPEEHGLVFKVEKHVLADGYPGYKLQASFHFIGNWKNDWKRVPIHALISVAGSQQPQIQTIWLPRNNIRITEKGYAGRFEFELTEAFIAFPGQKPRIPPSAWISFVHRDWQGPIIRVDFGAPKSLK
jgi:hypothetical protein